MRKFFKGLLIFIIVLVLLIVIPVGGILFAISDNTNDLDVNQYNNEAMSEVLSENIGEALDKMKTDYALEVKLSEEEVNNIIYSIIKSSINEQYNPVSGTTPLELNVYVSEEIPDDVPIIGGENIYVVSCYVEYIGDNIRFNVTFDLASMIKTRLQIEISVETTEDYYIINIYKIRAGKINLVSKGARRIITSFEGEDEVNNYFKENNIPFTYDNNESYLIGKKEEVNAWIISQINKDNDETVQALMDMMLGDKDALEVGMFDSEFGASLSLEGLRVASSEVVLDSEITNFNETLFVTNKSQSYVVNKLSGNNYIYVSELELNQLLYSNTNHYEGMGASFDFMGSNVYFNIEGIIIDLNEAKDKADIKLIANLNGIKTTILVKGDTYTVDGDIYIELNDKIKVGNGYELSPSIVNSLLGNALGDDSVMKWDSSKNAFVVAKDTLTNTLSKGVGSTMSIERLELAADGIRAYIATASTAVENTISEVVSLVEEVLASEVVTLETFDTTDPDQAEAAQTLIDELNTLSDALSNPDVNVTTENTDAIIEAIGNLSEENQQAFYDSLTDQIGQEELDRLYQHLFGGE